MTLRLHDVQKSYGGRPVLRDVHLDIQAGDAVAVLGPNGSGKSTLLRIAAALTPPDAGHVEVAGARVTRKGADQAAVRRTIAHLGQEPALYGDLTASEHVQWWHRLHGGEQHPGGTDALLADAGIAKAAHRRVEDLSRGQRQRLALALALLGRPSLLVLDEPFTSLDSAGATWLADTLARRRAQGAAVLVAVHDPAEADRVMARTVRLRAHRIEAA